ncbi:P-loop containing nucleoside triphosphate hydrolase protein [Xylaria sp. FL0043]|nr:P-loop containing nucleoside triphosphate hydrolase protein [Xylaria sp. FL0043]
MEPTFTNNVSSKSQRVSQRTSTAGGPSKGRGASSSGMPKESKRGATKRDAKSAGNASMATGKRRRGEPGPSTEAKPNKKRKIGIKRRDTQRKAEIMNQLGSLCDWRARWTEEPSEYTSQQYEREKHEHEVAIEILRSKYKAEGHEDCGNELGRINGMSSTIRDYQAVGAAFMVRHERARKDCRGGIIADDMGIGKTVQAIACMMVNLPSKKAMSEHRETTLIIVPNQGLIKQWAEELSRHAKISSRQVCKYAGGGKMGGLGIRGYPYVLATYGQVEREFRSFHNRNEEDEEDEAPLFEIEFFRIILDEGDSIKNYHGKTSKACGELKAKLKWVLSGTPLRNSVDECLPYFRFLGINVEEDLNSFTNKWGKPESSETYDRTMQILAKIMLRREAGQMFLGREMCALPNSHYEDRLLCITEEEKAVSRYLQQAMCRAEEDAKPRWNPIEGNEYEDKVVNRSSLKSNFRVRTTRLRQAAAHPFLLENSIRGFMNRDELENLIADLKQIELSKKKNKSRSLCSDEPQCSQSGGLTIYEIALDIKSHVGDVLSSWDSEESKGCLECFTMVELQPLECGHFICPSCYKEHTGDTAITGESQFTCVQCRRIVDFIPSIKEEPDNEHLSQRRPMKLGNRDLRSPEADFNGMQLRMSHSGSRWLKKGDEVGLITASTKTKAAIEIVVSWQEEAPDDRIVIFTEWIVTSKVLGRLLNKFDITFVYYNGDMSVKQRHKNLSAFKDNPDIKVMIMSVGTGNVGLNIVVANRMIIMDPWWNRAAEAQAFGRIKRHGQKKETHVIRLFAKDTIDERIYKLQSYKEGEIRSAMNQGKMPKPLSQEERYWLLTNRDAPDIALGEYDDDDEDDTLTNNEPDSDDGWQTD